MGNMMLGNKLTISIHSPSSTLYDFHKPKTNSQNPQQLTFPSFIRTSNNNSIEYSERSRFIDRQYEITSEETVLGCEINLRRLNTAKDLLWRSLRVDESVEIEEGTGLKLGAVEFQVKKICRSFHELDQFQENIRTLSEIDINENINLGQSIMRNSNLKRSKYYQKSLKKVPSNQSISVVNSRVNQDNQFCRICFGKEMNHRNPLLNLCKCSGSIKNIHYKCLKSWIHSKSKHISKGNFEYFEYDLSCDICKMKIDKIITHKDKKFVVFSQSLIHPPFVVLAHKNQNTTKVKQYIINFDSQQKILMGSSKQCDVSFTQKTISKYHCQLIYQNKKLFMRNLNPSFGTFVSFDSLRLGSLQNQADLMINNHLVRIKRQKLSCLYGQDVIIRQIDKDENDKKLVLV